MRLREERTCRRIQSKSNTGMNAPEKRGLNWGRLTHFVAAVGGELAAANVESGERVLDVGCGCGDTSIALNAMGANVWC